MAQGHKRVTVNAIDCEFDSHSRKLNIRERSILTLGSLCLLCRLLREDGENPNKSKNLCPFTFFNKFTFFQKIFLYTIYLAYSGAPLSIEF